MNVQQAVKAVADYDAFCIKGTPDGSEKLEHMDRSVTEAINVLVLESGLPKKWLTDRFAYEGTETVESLKLEYLDWLDEQS